jgi:hypothetical protein
MDVADFFDQPNHIAPLQIMSRRVMENGINRSLVVAGQRGWARLTWGLARV